MRPDERAVLERAIQRVTEQAANADAIVGEAMDAGLGGSHRLVVSTKILRAELLSVKGDLERELERLVLDCAACGRTVHYGRWPCRASGHCRARGTRAARDAQTGPLKLRLASGDLRPAAGKRQAFRSCDGGLDGATSPDAPLTAAGVARGVTPIDRIRASNGTLTHAGSKPRLKQPHLSWSGANEQGRRHDGPRDPDSLSASPAPLACCRRYWFQRPPSCRRVARGSRLSSGWHLEDFVSWGRGTAVRQAASLRRGPVRSRSIHAPTRSAFFWPL
jgi:hypothetical protein